MDVTGLGGIAGSTVLVVIVDNKKDVRIAEL